MTCYGCGAKQVAMRLDCGAQPICNRFLRDSASEEYTHEFVLGQCERCGLMQLVNPPVPAEELNPRYDWLTYREPEDHLNEVVERLYRLPGLTPSSSICGVSYKDDPLLERMRSRGFAKTARLDPARDLGVEARGGGVETVQDRLNGARVEALIRTYGRPNLLIARHILEHAHDAPRLLQALCRWLAPAGYLVLEVPDCTRSLETCDYTMLWEEHVLYFTPETFRAFCQRHGLGLSGMWVFPYMMENSIVGVAQVQAGRRSLSPDRAQLDRELSRARMFAEEFSTQRQRWQRWCAEYRRDKGAIVLFGAGHLSCTFVNLHELKDAVAFVVDDHPQKHGLFMPGSRLPIRGSEALMTDHVRLCLLGLSPEREETIIQRHEPFLRQGGEFASILLSSQRAWRFS